MLVKIDVQRKEGYDANGTPVDSYIVQIISPDPVLNSWQRTEEFITLRDAIAFINTSLYEDFNPCF